MNTCTGLRGAEQLLIMGKFALFWLTLTSYSRWARAAVSCEAAAGGRS